MCLDGSMKFFFFLIRFVLIYFFPSGVSNFQNLKLPIFRNIRVKQTRKRTFDSLKNVSPGTSMYSHCCGVSRMYAIFTLGEPGVNLSLGVCFKFQRFFWRWLSDGWPDTKQFYHVFIQSHWVFRGFKQQNITFEAKVLPWPGELRNVRWLVIFISSCNRLWLSHQIWDELFDVIEKG